MIGYVSKSIIKDFWWLALFILFEIVFICYYEDHVVWEDHKGSQQIIFLLIIFNEFHMFGQVIFN